MFFEQDRMIDQLNVSIFCVDQTGMIKTVNLSTENLLGLSRKKIKGLSIRTFLEGTETWFVSESIAKLRLSPMRMQGQLVLANGKKVAVYLSLTMLDEHILIELVDVEDLLQKQATEAKDIAGESYRQLLRNLAHEIKNPLGGIKGAAQLLEMTQQHQEDLSLTQVIVDEVDRLQGLVDQLLKPYKEALQVSPTDIHEVLEHISSLVGVEFKGKVEIVKDYDISIPAIMTDRSKILQVLLNLIRNAAEALEDDKTATPMITLSTRIVRGVHFSGMRHTKALCIVVQDNGPGVPVQLRDKLFNPLVTGKPKGTGLGLSLAQSFMIQLQGDLSLCETPSGAKFCLYLPLNFS